MDFYSLLLQLYRHPPNGRSFMSPIKIVIVLPLAAISPEMVGKTVNTELTWNVVFEVPGLPPFDHLVYRITNC